MDYLFCFAVLVLFSVYFSWPNKWNIGESKHNLGISKQFKHTEHELILNDF